MKALDIETMANKAMMPFLPEIKHEEFVPKLGNLKDSIKRREKEAEQRQKWEVDLQKKKDEQIEGMALNPLFSRIASCAFFDGENYNFLSLQNDDDKNEIALIKWINYELCCGNFQENICTYNGFNFDLPFIYKRAMILGVQMTFKLKKWGTRYTTSPHCDLLQVWSNFGGSNREKLDTLSHIILGSQKVDFDYREIPKLIKTPEGRSILEEYNCKDVKLTYDLYTKAVRSGLI